VAHEIVDAIIAQIDQMPPAELPGLAVDVDNPLGEK
jgi:hypothetical protein